MPRSALSPTEPGTEGPSGANWRSIPFRPFDIVMSNGARHAVPTPDHITITRLLRRIQVETDALHIAEINPLHVASIEDHQDAA